MGAAEPRPDESGDVKRMLNEDSFGSGGVDIRAE